ncbi:sacsin N-terminal ATP-binding-like domain-containing protein [Sedimentisphaera salicampi]|uniref:sacsin N-terminal ATP-binding-like domain-containing protein n=1 Tax=Sedimentisphaera salicampi TaxID=1941349 RepID=UPI000B9C2189|nr:hypothetical protein [Sedimentisphaera salicampi]OXU16189.1 hypothetical protein SMSP1_00030 [Sedimentisphaera salicampi]
MKSFEDLTAKRKNWVEANRENGFEEGITNLLRELYPDNAHFIYELLQNAEDAQASSINFNLYADKLIVRHNGRRQFDYNDVESITSIGKSTKSSDATAIGEFGVGFKAVFSYTNTPRVYSKDYNFQISDLVVPEQVLERKGIGNETVFEFPFNNPYKPNEKAFQEIEKGLYDLKENTLLFLTNIKSINFYIDSEERIEGSLKSEMGKDNILRLSREINDEISTDYWLRFQKKDIPVEDEKGKTKNCNVAVAYKLEKIEAENRNGTKNTKYKIVPYYDAGVSIYFPAVKETTGLKFQIHAPFASTVARDSVRDCEENERLVEYLADLIAEKMADIKKLKMLDIDFLSILPSSKMAIEDFYEPIRERLIEEFDEKELLPMRAGGYSKAGDVYRGSEEMGGLISDADLAGLQDCSSKKPLWVKSPPKINDFLSMLDVSSFTPADLLIIAFNPEKLPKLIEIMEKKVPADHLKLYDLIYKATKSKEEPVIINGKLQEIPIILTQDWEYKSGSVCYFKNTDYELNEGRYFINDEVINDENPAKREANEILLRNFGVQEFVFEEFVKNILEDRYDRPDLAIDNKNYAKDLKLFMELTQEDRYNRNYLKDLFSKYYIFKVNEDTWCKPSEIFIDSPLSETGLSEYFNLLKKYSDKYSFSNTEQYRNEVAKKHKLPYEMTDLLNCSEFELFVFAEKAGCKTDLEVCKGEGSEYKDFYVETRDRSMTEYIFKSVKSLGLAKLLWRFISNLPCEALYEWSRQDGRCNFHKSYKKVVDGEIVNKFRASAILKPASDNPWVPQKTKNGFTFVLPREASKEMLPEDLCDNPKNNWLEVVEFEKTLYEEEKKRHQEKRKEEEFEKILKDKYGISLSQLEKLIPSGNTQVRSITSHSSGAVEFPERKASNCERRKNKIIVDYNSAPVKEYKKVEISQRISRCSSGPRSYLSEQYRNIDDFLVCQICKEEMPKKKYNHYYFEAVEAFDYDIIKREHDVPYLALCPDCAAKYKDFIKKGRNGELKELRDKLLSLDDNDLEVSITLSESDTVPTIRFTQQHLIDIKAVLSQES